MLRVGMPLLEFTSHEPSGIFFTDVSSKVIKGLRPTKSNVDNFDNNYDFNGKVIAIGLRVKRFDNFMPRVMCVRLRVNFHNFFITFS